MKRDSSPKSSSAVADRFVRAAKEGDLVRVALLLEESPDCLNEKDRDRSTALMAASEGINL
jgi:hypothetical protein